MSESVRGAMQDRGSARVDGILRLAERASRLRPLPEVLGALLTECTQLVPAEVASLYLRERGEGRTDELHMIANVGFPIEAIDRVRLRVGEGVVGHVAKTQRPVSLELADQHASFKAFPELGEERFPIFLAVPLLIGARAEGVLVVQRHEGAFDEDDVALVAALTTSFALAIERARTRRSEDESSDSHHPARLEGVPLAPGAELGRIETLPTFEGLAALERKRTGDASDANGGPAATHRLARVMTALEELVRDFTKARRKLEASLEPRFVPALLNYALLETDGRLVEAIEREVPKQNLALALRRVARDYAQAALRAQPGADQGMLAERSDEVEELCRLIAARAIGLRCPTGQAVLVLPERLSVMVTLAAVAQRTAAIAVCDAVSWESLGAAIARAAALPAVGDVGGLYAWAREGDVLLVDGDTGIVRVSPSASQIARFRQREKETKGG
jgi:phosphotransferase system enzyme I (PtsP)